MPFPPYSAPQHTPVDYIGDWVMLGTVITVLAFVVSYALFFNWRKTRAGAAIFYLLASFEIFTAHVVFSRMTGGADFWGRDVLRLAVYLLPFIAAIRLLYVLWSNYSRGGKLLDLQRRPHPNTSPTQLKDGERTIPKSALKRR